MKCSTLFYYLAAASSASLTLAANSTLLNIDVGSQPVIDVVDVKTQNGVVCLPNFYPLQDYDPMRPASVPTYTLPQYDESVDVGPNATLDADVQALLDSLTLEEKAGQLVQVEVGQFIGCDGLINTTAAEIMIDTWKLGSVLEATQNHNGRWNINSPQRFANFTNTIQSIALKKGSKIPLIWGLDTIRGANYIKAATIFPAPVNTAATFNPANAYNAGRVGAKDTRAAGVHWAFSPLADINRNKLWSRNFENFGEDPFLAGEMVYHNIKGLQGDYKNDRSRVAACIKHFIAYSTPTNGKDRDHPNVPWNVLLEYFVPAFKRAIDAGSATAMEDYGLLNGQNTAFSKKILNDLLRTELGFNGMLVTDWGEINSQWNRYQSAFDVEDAVYQTLNNSSIDMSMTADDIWYANSTINLVKAGKVSIDRVNESVGRILQLKKDLGLFSQPYSDPSLIDTVGSKQDVDLSRNSARESLVLLKNEKSVLPLATTENVLFVGPAVNSINYITGAWAIHWQGVNDFEGDAVYDGYGESVMTGIFNATGLTPHYIQAYNISGYRADGYDDVVKAARGADKVVFFLGEKPSTEGVGDINTLRMAQDQYDLVESVYKNTETPIVLALVQNRPFSLGKLSSYASGIINVGLPGPYGGMAVAEVLYGQYSPSGRMPYTYPKMDYQASTQYYTPAWNEYDPEFAFGQGMGYNNITYSNITVSSTDLVAGSPISVSITATNNGAWEQSEPVLMYTSQVTRRGYSPELYRLRAFDKQTIAPGSSFTYNFNLTAEQMSFVNVDLQRVISEGPVVITMNAFNKNAKTLTINLHES
ncbi:Lysosomal beta glucosidase [Smittium mucronatum]|uniref:beta-glucosidase n=1 Tax=Smittium mucronatum TaxID=133383 RepID=A0A1R0GTV9_9FUNG|nr:Lysosomal beta glucosidase [Smittium mucronatum]